MKLFEIQIPVKPNPDVSFDSVEGKVDFSNGWAYYKEYHDIFLEKILDAAGGYSVLPQIDGVWVAGIGSNGKTVYIEKMIPVRFALEGDEDTVREIAEFAKTHYDQQAIFVAEIGTAKLY